MKRERVKREKNLESHAHVQGKMHAQKSHDKTLSFNL